MTKISICGPLPRSIGLSRAQLAAAARRFAELSARRGGVAFREVTIVLQDDAASAAAHLAIMGVEGATDVITQPYDPMPGEREGVYGELYVNSQRALGVASRSRWSPAKEMLLYVAHGMDHLSGADDHSPGDMMRMRRRELKWLRELQLG